MYYSTTSSTFEIFSQSIVGILRLFILTNADVALGEAAWDEKWNEMKRLSNWMWNQKNDDTKPYCELYNDTVKEIYEKKAEAASSASS